MVIDIIFAILAAYGFYLGFSKGIIRTVFSIISVLFGLMAAFKFGPSTTELLKSLFTDHPLMFVAGFLLSFVLTMFLIRLFAKMIEGLLEKANINIINQVAGGVLLSGMMILVYSVLLWFADKSNLVDDASKQQSLTYQYIQHYPEQIWKLGEVLRPTFQNFWDHSIDFMDDLQKLSEENLNRVENQQIRNKDYYKE